MDILPDIADMAHRLGPWAFAGLLLGAAWSDIRSYAIPDRYSVLIALAWPVYALSGAADPAFLGPVAVAAAVFAVGAALFAAGLMGGGDVKLMTAAALWAGTGLALPFLFVTAFAGGVLSMVCLARCRIAALAGRTIEARDRRVPYGVAIAAGGLFVAARLHGL